MSSWGHCCRNQLPVASPHWQSEPGISISAWLSHCLSGALVRPGIYWRKHIWNPSPFGTIAATLALHTLSWRILGFHIQTNRQTHTHTHTHHHHHYHFEFNGYFGHFQSFSSSICSQLTKLDLGISLLSSLTYKEWEH